MNKHNAAMALVPLILVAGCLGGGNPWTPSQPVTNSSYHTDTQTSSPVPFNVPHTKSLQFELAVIPDSNERVFHIVVRKTNSTETVFDKQIEVGPNTVNKYNITYHKTGNYTLTAELDDNQTEEIVYHVRKRDPNTAVYVAVSDEGDLMVAKRYD